MLHHKKTMPALALLLLLFISVSSSYEYSIQLNVYKNPTCDCCGKWISHVESNGFDTIVHKTIKMDTIKDNAGVPANYRSCHTSISKQGYVFEGHIPADIIHKFLIEKPKNAKGLIVPGMPLGSPGMEYRDKIQAYDVLLLNIDGSVSRYETVNTLQETLK
jgi:hypothetical protein